jgi:hypothetical protein
VLQQKKYTAGYAFVKRMRSPELRRNGTPQNPAFSTSSAPISCTGHAW